ncbi:Protein of unknown function [Cotesia congregata]|uniref:Uncharacterized protein n=1 Tax=Cotesia congregata TaxID=51543 RepID=A0A8J2H516_COTCN|nr:Protein of unknown function [Cotesia congregata]
MKTENCIFLLCLHFGIIFSGGFSFSNDLTEIDDNQEFTVTTKALKELMQTSRDLSTVCAIFSICSNVTFISKLNKTIIDKKETTNSSTTKETKEICSKKEDCRHEKAECIANQCQYHSYNLDKKSYSHLNERCTDSSDCMTTRLVCQNNGCVKSNVTMERKNWCHHKLGASVCWGPERGQEYPNIECFIKNNIGIWLIREDTIHPETQPGECDFNYSIHTSLFANRFLQDDAKLVWKNSSTADLSKAVYAGMGNDQSPTLICQTVLGPIKFVGTSFPPYFHCSHFEKHGSFGSTVKFNILVHDD